ncbi:MAG: 23S rRNA (pseudouridine(1915)-N(3))-methyltransferase RlmH [Clostridium sp.]
MKIKIITVGKLKEEYLKSAIKEYTKRINKYSKVEIIEVQDEKIPENAKQKEKEQILKKEASKILKHIKGKEYIISLAIEGKLVTSEEIAKDINDISINGYSEIVYIIGGSLGIMERLKKESNKMISFGRITLPHQLMRVVLLEQIYRGFKILNNETYHK